MTFFSHKKIGATLYQSKPVISSTPSLNVDRNCRFFIQPVGRASSLSCKTMMRLFPRAGWNWRLQRGLQVDLLGGGAPLGLPDHLPAAPPQCPPRNHLDKEPSQQWGRGWEGRELSKCDIWPRMVIILTDFWIFTKKLSIGDIFSHKNWCHLPLNSHESTKISIKKSPKSVTIYSLKMSPKLVKNKSPKKVKSLVNQQHFYKKITKIGDNLLTGNVTKIGEKSFTKKSENFSESVKFSTKKSPKLVTFYSMKISPKLVTNSSPKKVKILVNH